VRVRRERADVARVERIDEDAVVVLVEARVADGDQDVAVLIVAALEQVVLDVDVEVAHLHRRRIDEQRIDVADLPSVRRDDLPAAHVRITFGDLEVVELIERHDPVHFIVRHPVLLGQRVAALQLPPASSGTARLDARPIAGGGTAGATPVPSRDRTSACGLRSAAKAACLCAIRRTVGRATCRAPWRTLPRRR
jgi:hypothetical protein